MQLIHLYFLFQTLVHEQNNELSKLTMYLENALDEQNFDEVQKALEVIDDYSSLTQAFSKYAKKTFLNPSSPMSSVEDFQLLMFIFNFLAKKKKKTLDLVEKETLSQGLTYSQISQILNFCLENVEETDLQIRWPQQAGSVRVNSSSFDLETIWKYGI